jgi:hypothetical protein
MMVIALYFKIHVVKRSEDVSQNYELKTMLFTLLPYREFQFFRKQHAMSLGMLSIAFRTETAASPSYLEELAQEKPI